MSDVTLDDLEAAIRNVPDFPQSGIQFKDITPVLGDARLFTGAIDLLVDKHAEAGIDACVGIDARGACAQRHELFDGARRVAGAGGRRPHGAHRRE